MQRCAVPGSARQPPSQFISSGRRASEYVPLFSQLTPQEFPATLELMPYQARTDWDQQFNIGLDLIFDGLKARLADAGNAAPDRDSEG